MTHIFDDPATFAEDALAGFCDLYPRYVARVPGGVVRTTLSDGKVAVVVGGGSGHYPAFAGLVGRGFADGAVVGNIFTSPSADDAASVGRAAHTGAGVLFLTGNYAGDVLNFTQAVVTLAEQGIDAHLLVVTDDIASAGTNDAGLRRGIAGDFAVFKVASAAAEAGADLETVTRIAGDANARTRSLGVAFSGCTLPGNSEPLFDVPFGKMGLGLGIHGEPGIQEVAIPSARELARLLVDGVLAEAAGMGSNRVAVIVNGLGATKHEELFLLWGHIGALLRASGLELVEPEVGEIVTSLDMAGCSLTLMWLDDRLYEYWAASADTPAYRKPRAEADVASEAVVEAPNRSPSLANARCVGTVPGSAP